MQTSVREYVCLLVSRVYAMRMLNVALDAAKAMSACMRISVQVIASQPVFKVLVALLLTVAPVAAQMVSVSAN